MRSLQLARGAAAQFAGKRYEATLDARNEALRAVAGARSAGADYARERYEATIGADTSPGRRALTGFDDIVRRYSRSWGQQGIRARVEADIRRAYSQIRAFESYLGTVTNDEHRVRVEAEILRARQRLEGLRNLATAVGANDPTVSVNVRGAAASAAQLLGLQGVADRLDGYNVRFKADIDDSLSRALPNLLGALEQQLARYKTVGLAAAAVTVPLLYTKFAAIPAVASAAAGSVASLSISLGKGLVGASGAAGAALGLGAASLLAYGAAVRNTWQYSQDLTDTLASQRSNISAATRNVKYAEEALAGAAEGTREYAAAQRALGIAQGQVVQEQAVYRAMLLSIGPRTVELGNKTQRLQLAQIRFAGAVREAVAPALIDLADLLIGNERAIRNYAVGFAGSMDAVAQAALHTATTGRSLKTLQAYFDGIRRAGPRALLTTAHASLFLLEVLKPVVPAGLAVERVISHASAAALRWSQTARGQRQIASTWANLFEQGRRLYGIALDLGAGLWGVSAALDASGTGDYLIGRAESAARAFRDLMSVGGAGRPAILRQMERTRPLLVAVEGLARTAGRELLHLTDVVMGARMENGTPVLVEIVRAMEDSVVPLMRLLAHEFEVIGPLVPDLIRGLSEYFRVFAQSTPEMVLFIDTFSKLLGYFNSLPEPMRVGAARTIAYVAAFKALGGGAIIGGIASLASTLAQLLVFRKINQNTAAVHGLANAYKDLAASQAMAAGAPPVAAAPAGGTRPTGPVPPAVVPVIPDTTTANKGRFAGRLAAFLAGIPLVGPAVAMAGRFGRFLLGGVGTTLARLPFAGAIGGVLGRIGLGGVGRLLGGKLIGGLFSFLSGPVGWAYLIADTLTGGSLTGAIYEGAAGIVRRFKEGLSRGGIGSALVGALNVTGAVNAIKSGFSSRFDDPSWFPGHKVARGIVDGIVAGLFALPLVGPVIRWLDQRLIAPVLNFLGISSPSTRFAAIGRDVVRGLLAGIFSVPVAGALVGLAQRLWQNGRNAFASKGWGGLGRLVIAGIAGGLAATPLGGLAGRAASLFAGAQSAFRRYGWRGLGAFVVGAIAAGLAQTPLGGLASRAAGVFAGANRAFRSQGWRGIGAFAVGLVNAALRSGPLGGLAGRAGAVFSGARGAWGRMGWGGIGRMAVSAVGGALASTPLGQLAARAPNVFGGARGSFGRMPWGSIGAAAVSFLGRGLGGGFLGQLANRAGPVFGGARGSFGQMPWGQIGLAAVGFLGRGLGGGFLGQLANRAGPVFGGTRGAFAGMPWYGIGQAAVNAVGGGLVRTPLPRIDGRVSDVLRDGYNTAASWYGAFTGVGENLIQSLVNGLWNRSGVLYDALRQIAENGWKSLKAALGIGSPSKLFMYAGRMSVEGMRIALLRGRSEVARAAKELARAAHEGATLATRSSPGSLGLPAAAPLGVPQGALRPAPAGGGPTATVERFRSGTTALEERLEEQTERFEAAMRELMRRVEEVGPSVRESVSSNLRRGRSTRRSVNEGLDRTLRRLQFEGRW